MPHSCQCHLLKCPISTASALGSEVIEATIRSVNWSHSGLRGLLYFGSRMFPKGPALKAGPGLALLGVMGPVGGGAQRGTWWLRASPQGSWAQQHLPFFLLSGRGVRGFASPWAPATMDSRRGPRSGEAS